MSPKLEGFVQILVAIAIIYFGQHLLSEGKRRLAS
jgi:hypothetical protein